MPEYRQGNVQGASRLGALSKFMNLKRSFDDAVRQEQWKRQFEAQKLAGETQSKLLTQGVYTGQLQFSPEATAGSLAGGMPGMSEFGLEVNPNADAGGKSVALVDPITGEIKSNFSVPRGTRVYKGMLSTEQMKERGLVSGEVKAEQKDIEATQKLSNAVKRLKIINKQFKEAFPSGDRTPLEQRIAGKAAILGVKTGLYRNPKLLALQRNIRPIAINMIRMFGEVGNLSESEQQGAIDVVNQANLTDEERIAATKQFIEFALSGAGPSGISYLKNNRQDIQGILDSFNVQLDEGGEASLPEGVTEEDIRFTMQKHGLSREEVLQRIGGQ